MPFSPGFAEIKKNLEHRKNQILWTRFAADLDTPVSLMLRLGAAGENSFILESVTGGEVRGRYSIIGLEPDLIWRCQGASSALNTQPADDPGAFVPLEGDPLERLRDLIAQSKIEMPIDIPAASCGLFGYLGYDMIRLVEHLPNVNPDVIGTPDAMLMRPSLVAVLDGVKSEITLVTPIWANSGRESAETLYEKALKRLSDALSRLENPPAAASRYAPPPPARATAINGTPSEADALIQSNFSKDDYKAAVEMAKDYIKAGDIFQVVPSQRWRMPFDLPPFALYRSLRRTNPSPFMFYFNMGGFQIVGASPEILVRLREGTVTIRPIAGTRPRGGSVHEDHRLERELLNDPKEMAEHLMLLDLGRNDAGRVCKLGTVHPTEKFIIERYSHVMHIVSNVEGRIDDHHDGLSALLAGMPAGTVSGAPKVRAMEIIDALEPEKRGIYGGGVGYFAANGEMDFCIALRTAVVKDATLYIQAGGGVVYDSDAEAEWQETLSKSKALRQAAQDAVAFV